MTKRSAIEQLREELKQRNADSTYTNQFLYGVLMRQGEWLIRREISAGRIYRNNSHFQTWGCVDVVEASSVDCCPIETNCKMYRTKNKMLETWIDVNGPVILNITSIDGTTDFFPTTPNGWQNKRKDPYQNMSKQKYSFFSDGYFWFSENPHKVNIVGFYIDDISNVENNCDECKDDKKPCVKFLDTKFMIPTWVSAELFSKAANQLAGVSLKIPDDAQIDKNPNRKN